MNDRARQPEVPSEVLAGFDLDPTVLEFVPAGHINLTWMGQQRSGRAVVLQRVNPIFPATVNVEIDAVTRHLESKGLLTPRLIPSRGGQLWIEHDGVWRLQTRIRGVTHEALESEHAAREAGALLGRFHAALGDLDRDPAGARLGVHDLPRHLATLEEALAKHRTHRDLSQVSTLAEDIAALAAGLPPLPDARRRLVHGDPKISNVLFDPGTGEALCLIDLDTLARRAVTLELGDALRSWCNTRAEDDPGSAFSVSRFAAAIAGYAEAAPNLLAAGEWRVIPDATRRIALVLATRFCTDALNERYFAWDAGRFESASAHNQARTRAQLALAHSLTGARAAMLEIVERAAGP